MEMKDMKHLIRLTDFTKDEVNEIFSIADKIQKGKYKNFLNGKSVVMFFPTNSIRTRVSFEKGIHLLGGQTILFSPESLEKKENLQDVADYLNNWANAIIVRSKNIQVLETLAQYSKVPVINAMTDINHPCEVLSDMYSLSKIRKNYLQDKYLFCGTKGNIGLAWKEASRVMGFELSQCCPKGYELPDVFNYENIQEAVKEKDIVLTDSIPNDFLPEYKGYQITKSIMETANEGALLNPCPPFYRGEEVSKDVIDSKYFVGYSFKKYLLEVQQAIIVYCSVSS